MHHDPHGRTGCYFVISSPSRLYSPTHSWEHGANHSKTIASKLHGTAIEAFWSGTSFLLTSTILQPNYASFSHIFGRKPMVLISLVFFLVGALIGALAKNFTYMLVGRSIQGVGGGGIIVLSEIIVTDLVPLRFRGNWFALIGAMWAIGTVTG